MPRRWTTVVRATTLLVMVVAGMLATAQQATAAEADPDDVSYLNAAHQTNLAIVQASRVARNSGRACVREVAARFEADHRRLAAQELEAAQEIGAGLIAIPSSQQRRQLSALTARTGTSEYDAAWLAFQRQQQHRLLNLAKAQLARGADPAVRSVASGTQSVVRMHLRMIEPTCDAGPDRQTVPSGEGGQMADAQQHRLLAAVVLLGIGLLLLAGRPIRLKRHSLGVAAVVLAVAMVTAGPPGDGGKVPQAEAKGWSPERDAAIPPVRMALPGIRNTTVVPVVSGGDGQLQVPKTPNTVGWWAAGAAPGSASGTVLLVGHVDTATQARGVFAPLWDVEVGTKVAVTAADGDVHTYRIVARQTYKQDQLPENLFKGSSEPRLALVTCITYNRAGHHYTHNLVLYGAPVT